MAIVETIPRESIFLAQTPQGFRVDVLRDAIALGESGVEATDEAALAERAGHVVHIVEATAKNLKITTADDLAEARRRLSNEPIRIMAERVGTGYDLHRLVEGRPLVLGGIEIPCAARRARSFGCRRRVPRGDRRDPRRRLARRHRRPLSGFGSAVEGCLEHRSAAPGGGDGARSRLPGRQPGRRRHPRAAEDRAAPR